MGDPKGFLKTKRQSSVYRPVCERVSDFREVALARTPGESESQAGRCMDCGTPFCHWGCPVGNYIPEWNDMVFEGRWKEAFDLLDATNNLPEITGRVCPATCEYSCVLGINDDPVTIRENELAIIEKAFADGLIKPRIPEKRTGRKVAVVGSGPAGLACAMQLNRAGHTVTVYEKYDKAGGILRYGIPEFKLEKSVVERRISLMEKEGIKFITGVNVGLDIPAAKILEENDAVCLAGGSRVPRDLKIEGRELSGIHFAMDYLTQGNRVAAGEKISEKEFINAKGRKVVVIGGGDTGSDCVGTAHRQGASCVVQIEVMPRPQECRTEAYPWPKYPLMLKTSSSHEEGGQRDWSVLTKRFHGQKGAVQKLECVRVEFSPQAGSTCPVMSEIDRSEFEIEADLVILAVGFIHPEHEGPITDMGIKLDARGNVEAGNDMKTSLEKVFTAGDMRRGQSLVVWAVSEGRRAAYNIDKYLMGKSGLSAM
jgi:glutamate synthase (NADPH) small chain